MPAGRGVRGLEGFVHLWLLWVCNQLPAATRELILDTLALDARPACHDEERIYHLCVEDLEVDWMVVDGVCRVRTVGARRGEAR